MQKFGSFFLNRFLIHFIILDTTVSIINAIWHNFPNSQVIPLRLFVQEALLRSKTSLSTLKTALFYLKRIKPQIEILSNHDPAICGRRMFIASLIIASKYLQDRTHRNTVWAKICGLPLQEINVIERRFLNLINFTLFINQEEYINWTQNVEERDFFMQFILSKEPNHVFI